MTLDRREFLAGAAAASALSVAATSETLAKAPFATKQAPSFHRLKIGQIEVTSLLDGSTDLTLDLFPKANKAEAEALLEKAGRPKTGAPAAINAYVVNTGDKLFLVDSGCGTFFGPQAGFMDEVLVASGYKADDVDAIILTHMHPDHIGGVVDAAGKPAFKNARLLVNEADYTFWTDEVTTTKAPAEFQKFFRFAQACAKAYDGKVERFKDGADFGGGLTAVMAAGHTPGHSLVRVSSGKEQLLIAGDIIHSPAIQLARPDWAISFDSDPEQAAAARKRVFDQAAADGIVIAGAHIDFPGFGRIARETVGYSFHPTFWRPLL